MARDRDDFNLQAAFEFARDTIKHLLLVNGGAVVALLTFYGSLIERSSGSVPADAKTSAFHGLVLFATGVASAVICAVFAYLTQLKWGIAVTGDESKEERLAGIFHVLGMIFAAASAGCFVGGVYETAAALGRG